MLNTCQALTPSPPLAPPSREKRLSALVVNQGSQSERNSTQPRRPCRRTRPATAERCRGSRPPQRARPPSGATVQASVASVQPPTEGALRGGYEDHRGGWQLTGQLRRCGEGRARGRPAIASQHQGRRRGVDRAARGEPRRVACAGAHLLPRRARLASSPMDIARTTPLGGVESLLEEARERTLALVEPVSEADLDRQHDPLMSPLVWDLGHIAAFEDLWVCRETGLELLRPDLAEVYDATETPAPEARRAALPAPRRGDRVHGGGPRAHARQPRRASRRSSARCWSSTSTSTTRRCCRRCSWPSPACSPPSAPRPRAARRPRAASRSTARPAEIGFDGDGFAYDNERPRHRVELGAYRIDRAPVTNAQFLEFVEDGGYRRRELWSHGGLGAARARGLGAPALLDRRRARAALRLARAARPASCR